MLITKEQFTKILPRNTEIDEWYNALVKILPKYEINTVNRTAAFLAQVAHESANFSRLTENLNYSAQALMTVWPSRFDAETAAAYARNPEKIANKVYANRLGNGDEASGDGWRYRGRGLIQLTGKENYQNFGDTVGMSADDVVDYLQTKQGALESACWYWNTRHLNDYADVEDITTMTKRINGGVTGLHERIEHYNENKTILTE